jgi:hypothetical protein
MTLALNLGSAIMLFLSAGFWFTASRIKTPVFKGALSDLGEPLRELTRSLTRQSRLNWMGSIAAGIGVSLQGIALFVGASD